MAGVGNTAIKIRSICSVRGLSRALFVSGVLLAAPATAQPASANATLIEIDVGSVRGAVSGAIISWKGNPCARRHCARQHTHVPARFHRGAGRAEAMPMK